MSRHRLTALFVALALVAGVGACSKKNPPVARPTPPPPDSDVIPSRPPAPPEPVAEPAPVSVPPEPTVSSTDMGSLDDINKKGILQPVFFEFDSAEMSADGQAILAKNAETMKQFSTWVVSIEGHCDERGTAEYNLALGARRAKAVRDALVALGIKSTRLSTVSYGEELPICHDASEDCWARNRRGHIVDLTE